MNLNILRKTVVVLCLALVSACMDTVSLKADILAIDSFSYPDGETLYGQNGGTGWASIWTGSGMVMQGGRPIGGPVGNPPLYGSRNFNNPALGDPALEWLFVSIELNSPSSGIDDYFGVSTGLGVNNSQIAFGKRAGSPYFEVGNGGWGASNIVATANTTWHLIGAYRLRPSLSDTLYLWVNPDGADFLDPLTGANSADVTSPDFVAFPAGHVNLYTNVRGAGFDNLVISNSPGGVGLSSFAVPEPASLPVLLFLSMWVVGRRKNLSECPSAILLSGDSGQRMLS